VSVGVVGSDIGSVKAAMQDLLLGPAYQQALDDLRTRFGDGLELPYLEAAHTSEKDPDAMVYPCAWVLGDRSGYDGASSALIGAHALTVIFWVLGSDPEVVTKQVERYCLAFQRLTTGGSLMPDVANMPMQVTAIDYSPVGRGIDVGTFCKGGAVHATVETIDEA